VNVFIGKPNVGKSNILEGLGLLGAGFSVGNFLQGFARYNEIRHLFNDNDIAKNV
jgi:AAA15 family ATPase/GTPase